MAPGFGLEGPGLIPDAGKDPQSAFGVRASKIRCFGSPLVSCQQFTKDVVSGENFSAFQKHIKIVEVEMDCAAIYRNREAEIGLLLMQNRPPFSRVTYLLCLKPYLVLGFQSSTRQQQQRGKRKKFN